MLLNGPGSESTQIPVTDCGGFVDNYGGTITMSNMSLAGQPTRLFDCIWLIKPMMPDFVAIRTHLYLRLEHFSPLGTRKLHSVIPKTQKIAPVNAQRQERRWRYVKD